MSVTSLAYFLSGQRTAIEKIWRHELTSDKVVAYRNLPLAVLSDSSSYPVLNTVYLVDHVIRHKYPLNLDALEGCPTNFLMAATRVPSCRLDFLRLGQDDLYRIFKACLAVPACAVGPVRVGKRKYLDGGIANPLPVRPLLKYRGIRILGILSKPLHERYITCRSNGSGRRVLRRVAVLTLLSLCSIWSTPKQRRKRKKTG
jgi:predicted patatin/cPLA2 family phospholipase